MNKSQTQRTFFGLFESHEMSPLALLDLLKAQIGKGNRLFRYELKR